MPRCDASISRDRTGIPSMQRLLPGRDGSMEREASYFFVVLFEPRRSPAFRTAILLPVLSGIENLRTLDTPALL